MHRRITRQLVIATHNPGKLAEMRELLAPYGVEAVSAAELGLDEPEETGDSFRANAQIKAVAAAEAAQLPAFADDSGLVVDALDGAPGVYSARFAGPHATDEANNRLLLEHLVNIDDRRARFVCVIALLDGGEIRGTFEAAVEGEILRAPRGPGGFGYDPLFYYAPYGCTFGEATEEQKLAVSHRGQAFRQMLAALSA